jgi:hypothetical protein
MKSDCNIQQIIEGQKVQKVHETIKFWFIPRCPYGAV